MPLRIIQIRPSGRINGKGEQMQTETESIEDEIAREVKGIRRPGPPVPAFTRVASTGHANKSAANNPGPTLADLVLELGKEVDHAGAVLAAVQEIESLLSGAGGTNELPPDPLPTGQLGEIHQAVISLRLRLHYIDDVTLRIRSLLGK